MENHFDLGDLVVITALFCSMTFSATAFVLTKIDSTPHAAATLPLSCKPGEQILYTSAPKAELYVCESHWVRK